MSESARCPYCCATLQVVHVHGHGQCARCGTNVEPCCGGADALDEAGQGGSAWTLRPALLRRVFADLGGERASVTPEALRDALARALDVPLGEATDVIEVALRLQQLRRSGVALRLADGARDG